MPRLETVSGQFPTAEHSAKRLALLLGVEGSSWRSEPWTSFFPSHSLVATGKVVGVKISYADCWHLF